MSRQLSEAVLLVESPLIPGISWLVDSASIIGISERQALLSIWLLLLLSGCLLVAGFLCRAAAITAWFLQLCAAKSSALLSYGVDNFITIGLFYLMLAPLADRYSLERWLWGSQVKNPQLLGFFRRVLQVHLCFIYFFGGLTKSLGNGWWNGISLWRALTRPPFNVLPPEFLVHGKFLFPILGLSIWLIELSYPFLIWPAKTRVTWLALICAMHLAIGLTMGMYLFALIMIVLNVAAFGSVSRSRAEPVLGQCVA